MRAALALAARGWSVVPLAPRDKKPLVMWNELQRRLATEDEIRVWYRRWPRANVGIVTGALSGLVVLDVDPRHGGGDALFELERLHGSLPGTVEAVTGGGGRHIYFKHPGGVVRNLVALASGLDLRGDGGLVVAPPSIHPSGRRYVWESAHHPDKVALADMPGWLADLTHERGGRSGHPVRYWRALLRDGVDAGMRNNTIASLAGHLLWHGVDPEIACELLLCWNEVRARPPLDDEEVVRTVESITRLHRDSNR